MAWGLMAGGRGVAGHGGVTLSRGWLEAPEHPGHPPPLSDAVVKGRLLFLQSKWDSCKAVTPWFLTPRDIAAGIMRF